ncbi:MAG: hypothetical protein GY856_12545 [bacterium]|nr:hypothetical protein [bacterium]
MPRRDLYHDAVVHALEKAGDLEKGHYQILHVGWHGKRRVHGVPLHIDLHWSPFFFTVSPSCP